MKTLLLRSSNINSMFQQLSENLGGRLSIDYQEHQLDLENMVGQGIIRGLTFDTGISYLEFNMTFSEDCQLIVQNSRLWPICFAYCSDGSLMHSFGVDGEKRKLDYFQTGILASKEKKEQIFWFKKDVNLKFSLISVNMVGSMPSHKSELHNELWSTFFDQEENGTFIYIGSQNLKISDKISQLDAIAQKGIVRSLLIEGLVNMILALEIQQHSDDLAHLEKCTGSLTRKEMDRVKELSVFIENYPEKELSIKYLSDKSSLSPCKLQEGFKLMHNRTVADHIRDVRVQKAEELIKNTDLNISEVVYSIGFTSRSYFSKIFKQKYNCSPKEYKDRQFTLVATA
ncbi:AraC family transcriptional regulator [Flavobacteriaceae bacterium F89]|uniref:AraC family transcriptional regulator n=1 Tax=Cerina litoralis TaxID=2874477 RepID=A0AAE3JQS8_9FLAO|nr:AraC family transcriptional regulator [Cerina litoralis]MCG2462466.1 AraC family transcriptional regulator [Cerina litoralis]